MRAIQITLQTLETLGRLQPAGVSELARALDLPKSTVQRSLKALHNAGWIEAISGERGAWSLSLRALIAVGRADFATRQLRTAAIPVMEALRRQTKESIFLAARQDNQIALIERLDGINPVVHAWPLWRGGQLHSTSLGKAILAHFTPEQLNAYLDAPLAKPTTLTVTDPAQLRAELEQIRKAGFATSFRTNWVNENGVGCAILDGRGRAMAAISLSAPSDRVSEADCIAFGPLLVDAARRIGMGLAPG
jgi:IclR family acetate operon transcriptional repressor